MSKFINHLDARIGKRMEGGKWTRVCILSKDLFYESSILGGTVTVPRAFISDGASVPRAFWSLYPPFGKYLEAAVVHDWFCVLGKKGESPICSKTAARVFLEAMQVCGVSRWRRRKMYWAVALGGPRFKAKRKAAKKADN
tara:strand:- start:385 stop:804 length:420 start_codon:yes stop_codon:yes gene_type:complete